MATASSKEGEIQLLGISDGKCHKTFRPIILYENYLYKNFCFSPDSQYISTGKNIFKVENESNFKNLISSHSESLFSNDGVYLATWNEFDLQIWKVNGDKFDSLALDVNFFRPSNVAFSPNGNKLLVNDGSFIKIVDFNSYLPLKVTELKDYNQLHFIYSFAFSPNSEFIALAEKDILFWNLKSKKFFRSLKGKNFQIEKIVFSQNGLWLAAAIFKEAIIYNAENGQIVNIFSHDSSVRKLQFSPDCNYLATFAPDSRDFILWEPSTEHATRIPNVYVSDNLIRDKVDFSFTVDSQFLINDKCQWDIKKKEGKPYDNLKFQDIILTRYKDSFFLKNIKDEHVKYVLQVHPFSPADRPSMAISNDSLYCLCGSSFLRTLTLWEREFKCLIRNFLKSKLVKNPCIVSKDQKWMAFTGEKNTIIIYNVQKMSNLKILNAHENSITAIDFSFKNDSLASGGFDHSVKIWEILSGNLIKEYLFEGKIAYFITFSEESNFLIIGFEDNSIKIVKILNGEVIKNIDANLNNLDESLLLLKSWLPLEYFKIDKIVSEFGGTFRCKNMILENPINLSKENEKILKKMI